MNKLLALSLIFVVSLGIMTDANATGRVKTSEKSLFSLTNEDRDSHNKTTLKYDGPLARKAYRHSKAMANRGELFHTASLANTYMAGKNWNVVGENVGVTGADGDAMMDLEKAFMASTEHRNNILKSSYKKAAVGVYEKDGAYWVTVVFYG